MDAILTAPDHDLFERAVRKSARRLLFLLMLLLLFAVIDRGNIGYAALTMNANLGLTAEMFGFGGAMFLTGYVVFDVPSNMLLARFGARIWLTRIALTWGVATGLMALAEGPISFYVLRFFIGAAEAGCLPGIIYVLAQWFPHARRARYTSAVLLAIPFAIGLASPLAAAIVRLDGHLGMKGWQWLFLIEGCSTCGMGLLCWLFLRDTPADASWLDQHEKAALITALRREQLSQPVIPTATIRTALLNPSVLALALAYSGINAQMNFSSLWLPQIYRAYGATDLHIAALTAIPFLLGTATMVLVARCADRTGNGFLYVVGAGFIGAAAWLASAIFGSIGMLLVAFCVAACALFPATAIFWTIPQRLLAGPNAAAAIGLISAVGTFGAAVVQPIAGRLSAGYGWPAALTFIVAVTLVTPISLWAMRARLTAPGATSRTAEFAT